MKLGLFKQRIAKVEVKRNKNRGGWLIERKFGKDDDYPKNSVSKGDK